MPTSLTPSPSRALPKTRPRPVADSPSHRRVGRGTPSPVALTTQFLAALSGTDALAALPANCAALSRLLELEVTERGYLLLVAPLLGAAPGPAAEEIAAHTDWWFRQLP